jgi:hypothetical protein
MIVQIVNDTTHRLYFLKGTKLDVWCKLSDSSLRPAESTNIGQYLEVTADTANNMCDTGAGWQPVTDAGRSDFVTQVTNMAQAAGMQPSD